MIQKFTGLLLVALFISLLSHSQKSRKYSREKKSDIIRIESLFAREVRKIENATSFSRLGINSLIAADTFPLEQLNDESGSDIFRNIRQRFVAQKDNSLPELREEKQIDGQPWEISTKYINKGSGQLSFEEESMNYDLLEIIRVKKFRGEDSAQNITSTEKVFYWRSADPDHDFAISYKEYKLGKLKQEIKQVYAGKDQLVVFNNLAKSRNNTRAAANSNSTGFDIYPNPTNRSQVSVSYNTVKTGAPVIIFMYDITGRAIRSFTRSSNTVAGPSTLTLDIGRQPAGVYSMQLTHNGVSATQKLVITH